MKSYFYSFLLGILFFSSSAYAQLEKGTWLVGGNAGFSRTTTDNKYFNKSSFSYNLAPNLGYMITKGLAIGAVASYEHTSSKQPSSSNSSTKDLHTTRSTFSVGPALQYYYQLEGKWALGLQASFTWGNQSASEAYTLPAIYTNDPRGPFQVVVIKIKNNTKTFAVGPSLTYFLNPKVGLQGNLVYKMEQIEYPKDYAFLINSTNTKTSGIYFNLGLQIFLGK